MIYIYIYRVNYYSDTLSHDPLRNCPWRNHRGNSDTADPMPLIPVAARKPLAPAALQLPSPQAAGNLQDMEATTGDHWEIWQIAYEGPGEDSSK